MTAIGIDLGTTNSAVAAYDPERKDARVLRNSEGQPLTPSVVGIRRDDDVPTRMVGVPAVNFARLRPADTIYSVKRLMGRDFADPAVAEARSRLSYKIVSGPGDDPRAHVVIAGDTYAPAQVSTMILEKLAADAAEQLRQAPTHAVITVPAYFNEAQRVATRQAGEQAGLVVKRIIDEPTAAAIAFGVDLKPGDQRRILVYDLGGGTFDISILYATRDDDGHNHFQVLDFSGDNWLGGDDFDRLIVDRISDWVRENAGVDPSGDVRFLFTAKQEAEKVKRMLSQTPVVDIVIPAALRTPDGVVVDVETRLTRRDYDDLIAGLVARTVSLVNEALDRQNLKPADISDVLLVGGSTLTPKVYETVEAQFGKAKVRRDVDPMECVALGAGILAGTQTGVECGDPACAAVNDESAAECHACGRELFDARAVGDTKVYDVTGMALGVGVVRGNQADIFVPIIPRGTPYPLIEPMKQTFEATDGRRIVVPVYEGDSEIASQNQEVEQIEYDLSQEIDVRTRVEVEFNFDRNRTLHVTVVVPGTDLRHQATVRPDAPRASAAAMAAPDPGADAETARQELLWAVEAVEGFHREFGQYLVPAQSIKIQGDLDKARRILAFPEPEECRTMRNVLQAHLFESGLASQIFLAERTADRAAPEDARRITEALTTIRNDYQSGARQAAADKARLLTPMLNQIGQRTEVPEIRDAENFGGLLRILEN